jgi:hypothetical protein
LHEKFLISAIDRDFKTLGRETRAPAHQKLARRAFVPIL